MGSYHRLLEVLIKRELGILGREKMERILNELNIVYDFGAQRLISYSGDGEEVLQRMGTKIYEIGGELALIGARVCMILASTKENVQLPPIFS